MKKKHFFYEKRNELFIFIAKSSKINIWLCIFLPVSGKLSDKPFLQGGTLMEAFKTGLSLMSIIVLLMLIIINHREKKTLRKRFSAFEKLAIVEIVPLICNIVMYVLPAKAQFNPIQYIVNYGSFIGGVWIEMGFSMYLEAVISEKKEISDRYGKASLLFAIIDSVGIIIAMLFGFVFSIEDGLYVSKPGEMLVIVINMLGIVIPLAMMIKFGRFINGDEKAALYIFAYLPLLVSVIEIINPDYSFTFEAEAIAVLAIFIIIQNKRIDSNIVREEALDKKERDAKDKGEKQVATIRNFIDILYKGAEPEDAISEFLSKTAVFYNATRAYVFEINGDRTAFSNTYEWCAIDDSSRKMERQLLDAAMFDDWMTAFRKNEAVAVRISESAEMNENLRGILTSQGTRTVLATPIFGEGSVMGFVGVDNPEDNFENLLLLKGVSAIVGYELLRRSFTDEEHNTLHKLANSLLSLSYADFSQDYLHTYAKSGDYDSYHENFAPFNDSMDYYIEHEVAFEDRERVRKLLNPTNVMKQLEKKEKYKIPYVENMNGIRRNVELEFIRANDFGTCAVLVGTDNTEVLKREYEIQARLKEALKQAEDASRAKTEFLFNMSHDIRTPMNAIIGFTDMAKQNIDNRDELEKCLEKVSKSGENMLELLNDVLDMSHAESGRVLISENKADIFLAGREIMAGLEELAAEKGVTLSLGFGNIRDRWLYVDFLHMNRVLMNIITNAIKYTPKGGDVTVTIAQTPEHRPGYAVFDFIIEDTGIGISEEFIEHVFDPFARERNTTASGIQGTGLGLSIAKRFVDAMGGIITVDSEPRKGSVFTVTMPFRVQTAADIDESKASSDIADIKRSLKNVRVLVVEDNAVNREIIVRMLQNEGAISETAEDGLVAVDKVRKAAPGQYDIVLMDIQMPNLDGYGATRQIRSLKTEMANIPIVAVTANAFEEDRRTALEAGMNEHVPKPVRVADLKEKMLAVLK